MRLQIADRSEDRCQVSGQNAGMGFHICGGIRVRDTSITALEAHLMIRFLFVLNPTSTNPKQLHVKPVNTAASRASLLRLS